MTDYELALEIATRAHRGQKDKAGEDYILHPITVAAGVEGEKEKVCALLHDVMEDTDFSEASLRTLFGNEIVDVLCLLNHDKREDYFSYIRRISQNKVARAVKLSDLRHNSDLSRLKEITEKDKLRVEKYQKAIEILTE